MADQTENGSSFRILTLIDEYTRECLATHAAWSIRAVDVITVLEAAMARYGAPEHIRSDNGPEFIAHAIQDWLQKAAIKTIYITPGSPWESERSGESQPKAAHRVRRSRSKMGISKASTISFETSA